MQLNLIAVLACIIFLLQVICAVLAFKRREQWWLIAIIFLPGLGITFYFLKSVPELVYRFKTN